MSTVETSVKVIPLGGLEQIGMNMTVFEYGESIIVVDCGMSFPGDEMLGIDMVIPDITYLKQNIHKVKGVFITHGHEDHIGALPFFFKEINVPLYGTKLTLGIIEGKLEEHGITKSVKRKVVKYGQTISAGDFKVEFIRTNHSIVDAAALAITSPAGTIIHTGDFKIDYTPVFGDMADLQRFAELGKKGVLALLCDSTNALRPGFTASERTVGHTFDTIFSEHRNQRIIVATFASNVDRVQQIINTAYKYDRKVVVEGRSMVNIIGKASELGYINIPEGTLIDIELLRNYPPEKTVSKVINELCVLGAEVIYQDTHVSGHACQEEIKLMYSLVRPKYSIPVHGEFRHRKAQAEIAESLGIPKDNIFMIQSGDVLELSEESALVTGQVTHGGILVDGLGVGDVGNIVLRDRQNLSQDGIIIVVLTLERYTNNLLAGPDIVSRGFVYIRESENLMIEAQQVVEDAVFDCLDHKISDWSKIKNEIRDSLSNYLWKKMKRSPMILPIIMEVE